MKRLLITLIVAAALFVGAMPAFASQFGGHSTISPCARC